MFDCCNFITFHSSYVSNCLFLLESADSWFSSPPTSGPCCYCRLTSNWHEANWCRTVRWWRNSTMDGYLLTAKMELRLRIATQAASCSSAATAFLISSISVASMTALAACNSFLGGVEEFFGSRGLTSHLDRCRMSNRWGWQKKKYIHTDHFLCTHARRQ